MTRLRSLGLRVILLVVYLWLSKNTAIANDDVVQLLDDDTFIDIYGGVTPHTIDYTLFGFNTSSDNNLYEEITKYLYKPISTKRRGVEWWQWSHLKNSEEELSSQRRRDRTVGLSSSTTEYNLSGYLSWSDALARGWAFTTFIDGCTGRDTNIEGVFRNELSARITLSKIFSVNHTFSLTAKLPYEMRGLRGSATQECFDLVNNNLYNPLWGYYHGEVRNSRVIRNLTPSLYGRYSRPVGGASSAMVAVEVDYGTRRLSNLEWYNSSNPSPNYYSKLPSYLFGSNSYEKTLSEWQQNSSDYTQIAWDRLETLNLASVSGESYYVVEDQVERVVDIELKTLFTTPLTTKLSVDYGICMNLSNHRNYKQMRDLLGGDYLLDLDQYADEYTHAGNQLQNNLRNPNRKITEGDRFGYDYSHLRRSISATTALKYHTSKLLLEIKTSLSEEYIKRVGHYEKERFPGSASYGDSPQIELSNYDISMSARYTISPRHHLNIQVNTLSTTPLSKYLFIADQNNNTLIDNPTTNKINSATLHYSYRTPTLSFTLEGYMVSTRDITQVWQGYDDLSSTYCDIVISDIATRSIGLEFGGEVHVNRNVTLSTTLSCGGYIYSSAPLVTLYSDDDMSLIAKSQASTLKGYIVGNTPQITTSLGVKYQCARNLTLYGDIAHYARRYISPSIVRRTDRILNCATSTEAMAEMLYQEQLPNLLNANLSVVKGFFLDDGRQLFIVFKINNILGNRDIINYAREGNRILSSTTSGVTYSYSPQESTYRYSSGRTFKVSFKYRF